MIAAYSVSSACSGCCSRWRNFGLHCNVACTGTAVRVFMSRNCTAAGAGSGRGRLENKKYRVKKIQSKGGEFEKAKRLVQSLKGLSDVKEEVYGILDSLVAFDVEFPISAVKKALKILYEENDWKRIIQVTKWMFSKGQGKTLRNYYILMNALVKEERREEAEKLWTKLLSENLENTPRVFFALMISMYENDNDKKNMLEVFADMEELGVKPDYSTVLKIAAIFEEQGRFDTYDKIMTKYPKPQWEYKYIKGKRVKRHLVLHNDNNVDGEANNLYRHSTCIRKTSNIASI